MLSNLQGTLTTWLDWSLLARVYFDISDHFREVEFKALPFIVVKARAGSACMGCDVAFCNGLISSEKRPPDNQSGAQFLSLQGMEMLWL